MLCVCYCFVSMVLFFKFLCINSLACCKAALCCYTFCHRWSVVEFRGVADGCGQNKCSLQDSFHCDAYACVSMCVYMCESISQSECKSGLLR